MLGEKKSLRFLSQHFPSSFQRLIKYYGTDISEIQWKYWNLLSVWIFDLQEKGTKCENLKLRSLCRLGRNYWHYAYCITLKGLPFYFFDQKKIKKFFVLFFSWLSLDFDLRIWYFPFNFHHLHSLSFKITIVIKTFRDPVAASSFWDFHSAHAT